MDELKADMCDFIVEIRKENGEQYPPIVCMTWCLDLVYIWKGSMGFTNKLVSGAFREIRNTLDNVMKERTAEGVVGRPERDPILDEHEAILWDKGILGEDSPDKLRRTVFFLIGLKFGLRGLKEQHDLRRYPDSQINIVKIDGKDALVYREFQTKTRQGGYQIGGKNPARVAYSFCTGFRPRCLVELFRKYLFLGPRGSYNWPKFYVQTDSSWQPGSEYWYTNRPVGKNTLGGGTSKT